LTTVSYGLPRLDSLPCQPESMICCFQFAEQCPLKGFTGLIDWRLLGRLSELRISNQFFGRMNESLLVLPGNRLPVNYLVMVGAGEPIQLSKEVYFELLDTMFDTARKLKIRQIIVSLPGRDAAFISGEEAIPWFFEYCAQLLSPSLQFSCVIVDTFEMQSLIVAEAERHRMRRVLPEIELHS
jgi:hypothetical protein